MNKTITLVLGIILSFVLTSATHAATPPQRTPLRPLAVSPTSINFIKMIGQDNPAAQTVTIAVPSTARWTTYDNLDFVDVKPTSPTATYSNGGYTDVGPATLNITPSAGMDNLAAGSTYSGQIRITSGGLTSYVTVTVKVVNPPVTTYTLNITSTNGTVSKNPNKTTYNANENVVLTATPKVGYQFSGWGSDATGGSNPLTLTMNANKNIVANFTEIPIEFSVTPSTVVFRKAADGTISPESVNMVIKMPVGARWTLGDNSSYIDVTPTSGKAPASGEVIVVARPSRGAVSAIADRSDMGKITVDGKSINYTLIMSVAPVPVTYTLNAMATNGSISKLPNKLSYGSGENVTLTATPAAGYQFSGWSGDISGATNPLSITMSGNKTITANFTLIPVTTYTLTTTSINGAVTKNPNKANYNQGETVTLTAAPNAGYQFSNWSQNAAGTVNPIVITMDTNKSVAANFTAVQATFSVNPLSITFRKEANGSNPVMQALTINVPAGIAWSTFDTIPFADVAPDPSSGTGPRTINLHPSSGMLNSNTVGTYVDKITVRSNGVSIEVPVTLIVGNPVTYSLTANTVNGTITKNPNQATFNSGAVVQLTASPIAGYKFDGWNGDASGATNPLSVTMTGNKTIGAMFSAIPVSAPTISQQPTNQSASVGGSATFSIMAVGNPVPTYQWHKGNTAISGATNASYTTPLLSLSDTSSTYKVVVSNSQGSVTSNVVTLSVTAAPAGLSLNPSTNALPTDMGDKGGSSLIPIADWDVVPFQAVSGTVNIGVLAFHVGNMSNTTIDPSNGIDKISFSIGLTSNAYGPWFDVRTMANNSSTCTTRTDLNLPSNCVTEYFAPLNVSALPDGVFYVNAVVYPKLGRPIKLKTLQLYANSRNTLNQVRCVNTTNAACTGGNFTTISAAATDIQRVQGNANGGTILVGAGTYDGGTGNAVTTSTYLTIKAAPGVARSAVVIDRFSGTPTKYLRFDGLTCTIGIPNRSPSDLLVLWHSNFDLHGDNRFDGINWNPGLWTGSEWANTSYFTDGRVFDALDGPRGATIVRNVFVEKATGAFSESHMVINSLARDINADGWNQPTEPPHSDFYQAYSNRQNVIIYNVKAVDHVAARGISFAVGMTNAAVVDSEVDADASSDFGGEMHNLFIKNSNLHWTMFLDNPPKFPASDIIFEKMTPPNGATRTGVTIRNGT